MLRYRCWMELSCRPQQAAALAPLIARRPKQVMTEGFIVICSNFFDLLSGEGATCCSETIVELPSSSSKAIEMDRLFQKNF